MKHDSFFYFSHLAFPQCNTAEAEIKAPSVENQELKQSKVLHLKPGVGQYIFMQSYAYCQGFLPC